MPEFNSRQKTNLANRIKVHPSDTGKVRVDVATTPTAAAWAQNDTFSTGIRIPAGSRILRTGKVYHGAFGTSVTMDVGVRAWSADGTGAVIDADGLAAALNVAAAGNKLIEGGALLNQANGYLVTSDVEVYATLAGANPTDDIQAEFEIHWVGPDA